MSDVRIYQAKPKEIYSCYECGNFRWPTWSVGPGDMNMLCALTGQKGYGANLPSWCPLPKKEEG